MNNRFDADSTLDLTKVTGCLVTQEGDDTVWRFSNGHHSTQILVSVVTVGDLSWKFKCSVTPSCPLITPTPSP
ncbi:hypothetical protein PM082_015396 [Marasmius tenuissimus]|nr:hypothetical protein PM082_015396 [Marasmius tenuissimus]